MGKKTGEIYLKIIKRDNIMFQCAYRDPGCMVCLSLVLRMHFTALEGRVCVCNDAVAIDYAI